MNLTQAQSPIASSPVHYIQVETGAFMPQDSDVIVEMPVSLTVNGEFWLTFMCTPVDLEALAVGFLANEGYLASMDEIASIHVCASGDNIDIWLNHAVKKPTNWRRTSGCTGGQTSIIEDHPSADTGLYPLSDQDNEIEPKLPSVSVVEGDQSIHLSPLQVSQLVEALFDSQSIYRLSGGVHTSALSDGTKILVACEDIGRHNTLDKIAGRCLMDGIDSHHGILLTTGRISSEMLQKADHMGAVVVISRTSPSSLSIQMAHERGITLIGYARRHKFNVYTHPVRILNGSTPE